MISLLKIIKKKFFKDKNEKIKELEEKNIALTKKLSEKQEVINETNAFWKKKLYNATKGVKKK